MHQDYGPSSSQNSTNAYVAVGGTIDGKNVRALTVEVINTGGSNAADFKLQGALSDTGTTWWDVSTAAAVIAGASAKLQSVADTYYTRYRVVVKSSVNGSATAVNVVGGAGLKAR